MGTAFARAWFTAGAGLFVFVAPAVAQQPTFRSRVDLVTVDATVLDRDGRPVAGLEPEDFRLLVDGRPRRVVSAQFVTYESPEHPAISGAPGAAARHLDGRVILIAVDQSNIRRVEGGAAVRAAAAFIDTLGSADRVAAIGVDDAAAIEFTSDHARVKRQLSALLGRAVAMPVEFPIGIAEAIGVADGSRGWLDRVVTRVCGQPLARVQRMERMAREEGMRDPCPTHVEQQARALAYNARNQGQQSVDAVERLLRRLDDIEGPKTLVIVSEGLIAELRVVDLTEVTLLAQQARATIYVLQVDVPLAEAGDEMISPTSADDVRVKGDGLARLAGAAGGTILTLVGSDPQPFGRILRETSGYYLLAFEPLAADRDGETHRITVSVERAGTSVRARPLFAVPPPPSAPATVEDQLVQLLRSRRVSTTLPLRLGITKARAADRQAIEAHVTVELESSNPDATYGAVVVDAKGVVVTSATSRTTTGRFAFAATVVPGRYLFRVAAVDASGQAGTAERTVEVDLPGGEPRTSDLILRDADVAAADPTILDRTSARAVVAAVEIYAPAGWKPGSPVRLTLSRAAGGEPVTLAVEPVWDPARQHWIASGRFTIDALPPGRYAVAVLVPGAAPLQRSFFIAPGR